jgi:hypothetical protein
LKNLTVPVMAIGKLLPRIAPPLRASRVSADRTFTAGSLATWVDRDQCPPIDLDFLFGLDHSAATIRGSGT